MVKFSTFLKEEKMKADLDNMSPEEMIAMMKEQDVDASDMSPAMMKQTLGKMMGISSMMEDKSDNDNDGDNDMDCKGDKDSDCMKAKKMMEDKSDMDNDGDNDMDCKGDKDSDCMKAKKKQKLKKMMSESSEKDFIKSIIKLKNGNKNKWYTFVGEVEGMKVKIKGYGTWLQIFNVDGTDYGNSSETSVKGFKELLAEPF